MLEVINHKDLSIFEDMEGNQYCFGSIAEALEFSEAYHRKPIAALFAYHMVEGIC